MNYIIKTTNRWNKTIIIIHNKESLQKWIDYFERKRMKYTIEERQ